jgi:serine O-acetyltransferase
MPTIRTTDSAQVRLEGIIDSVTRSYEAGRGIDSLESSALPNQRKTVEALGHLKHAIYMGYYSTRNLSGVNLRQHVGEHVYEAFEILVEQTARAVVYRRLGGGAPQAEDRARSEKVVLEVFEMLPQIREAMSMDIEAAFLGDPSAESIEEIIFSYPACEAITVHRIAHEFYRRDVPMIPRIMAEYAHGRTGIDIHPGARIGRRFFIDHGTGVVVGETCRIGDNVKLYQGVTLGALSLPQDKRGELIRGGKRHPTIEDDVTIYAGAKILGGDTVVGAGSVIGGNVWLTASVPAGSRVTYEPPTCDSGTGAVSERMVSRLAGRASGN